MGFDRRQILKVAASGGLTSLASACVGVRRVFDSTETKAVTMTREFLTPLIIAHRGASGYLPEHTLPGYRLGANLGADYIEPDLVFTKDGHLVARHDNYLSTTTDVADHSEFAARKTEKPNHDGPDWFSEDFTLAEIKTLRTRQAFSFRSQAADGMFHIPTFGEVIALAQAESKKLGRTIGVYPETKQPGYFAGLGYDYPRAILDALDRAGWAKPGSPVFIQSFETPVLKTFRDRTELRLIYLIERNPDETMSGIASFAHGIGPYKGLLADDNGRSTGLLESAHEAGLKVHPWTFRADQLPSQFKTAQAEFDFFYRLGVDGVFTDFPDAAYAARLTREIANA